MDEVLQEFVDSRGVNIRIDRAAGVIRGVKLLGFESRNGRRYLPEALAQAVGLYEGAKVNVNHPKGNPLAARDYQDRLGRIRNVAVRPGEGVFGDLHFNPCWDPLRRDLRFEKIVISLAPNGAGMKYIARVMHSDEEGRRKHEEMGFHAGWGKALDQLVAVTKEMN